MLFSSTELFLCSLFIVLSLRCLNEIQDIEIDEVGEHTRLL